MQTPELGGDFAAKEQKAPETMNGKQWISKDFRRILT